MAANIPSASEAARYKVFINKMEKHILVLQLPHLDRDRALTAARLSCPLQIRIKPKNGLVELDVPLPDAEHISKRLAAEYGIAMSQHKAMTNGGTVGIASGFGSAHPTRVKRQPVDIERAEDLLDDFDHSMDLGIAMNSITLTGLVTAFKNAGPAYYLGSFHGNELHLTKVSAICNLSVGLQHLDAQDTNEKAMRKAAQEEDAPQEKALLVGMQVKSVDEIKTEESQLKQRLRNIQEEPWQKLDWVDEGDQVSFDMFHDKFFLGKSDQNRRVIAVMSDEQYLGFISTAKFDPTLPNRRVEGDGTLTGDEDITTESDSSEDEGAGNR